MKLVLNNQEIELINAYEHASEDNAWFFHLEFQGNYSQKEIQELFTEEALKNLTIVDDQNHSLVYTTYTRVLTIRIELNSLNLLDNYVRIKLMQE